MTSNNDHFLELADEFDIQFPDDLTCKIFLGDICGSTLPPCRKCGVACYQRSEDPNFFRCQLCLRKVRVFAQTTFHGIRKFKPWLAALWISLRQAVFSAAELARRFSVAPATAANVRRKISIKFAELMTPIKELYSGVFTEIFGRRSTETPAREHPRAEQFEIDKIIELFEASNLPINQEFFNDLKSIIEEEEKDMPDQIGSEFNGEIDRAVSGGIDSAVSGGVDGLVSGGVDGLVNDGVDSLVNGVENDFNGKIEIESFDDELMDNNPVQIEAPLKQNSLDSQKLETKAQVVHKEEPLYGRSQSQDESKSDASINTDYRSAEENADKEETLRIDFTPSDKADGEQNGAEEFEKSTAAPSGEPYESTFCNELSDSQTQLLAIRQLILKTLSIGNYTNVEGLLNATRLDLSELLFTLGMLEFEGLIESAPGLLYRKCKTPIDNLAHFPTAISEDFKNTVKTVWKRISRKYLQPYLGHYWIANQTEISADEILKSFACRDGTGSQLSSKYVSPHYVNVPTLR